MQFTVEMRDFRAAVGSVLPHVGSDPELPILVRMRFHITEHVLTAIATDMFTAALAMCSVYDLDDEGVDAGAFDVHPLDVAKILRLFKPGKGSDEQWTLELDYTTEDRLSVADTSGMVAGDVLEVGRLPLGENYPDLRQTFANWLSRDADLMVNLAVGGEKLTRFRSAASAYDSPLDLSRNAGTPLLIRCGESFLGALMPIRVLEDDLAQAKAWAAAWESRLPTPSGIQDIDAVAP